MGLGKCGAVAIMSPMAKTGEGSSPREKPRPRYGLARYWEAAQEPLYSLLFLLPFVAT